MVSSISNGYTCNTPSGSGLYFEPHVWRGGHYRAEKRMRQATLRITRRSTAKLKVAGSNYKSVSPVVYPYVWSISR